MKVLTLKIASMYAFCALLVAYSALFAALSTFFIEGSTANIMGIFYTLNDILNSIEYHILTLFASIMISILHYLGDRSPDGDGLKIFR